MIWTLLIVGIEEKIRVKKKSYAEVNEKVVG